MARGTSLLGGGSPSALRALCRRPLPSIDFRNALRAPLHALIEFDGYCVNTCDVDTGVVTSSVGDGLSPEQARLLFALEAEGEDFNGLRELHRGPQRIASIWQSTNGEPTRSARMARIFVPLGFGDELRAALAVGGDCFGYLHLFRRTQRGPFLAAELKLLKRLIPVIAGALRRCATVEGVRPTKRDAPSPSPSPSPSLLVLDANNQLVRHSEAAPALVAELDCLRLASGSAHVLQDLVSRARAGANSRASLSTNGAVTRTLSAVQLGAETAVIIDQRRPEAGPSLLASTAELTPGERKVSACIARGETNRAIAARLGLSLYTVKDYVKSILNKTGCANRSTLAARWNGGHS